MKHVSINWQKLSDADRSKFYEEHSKQDNSKETFTSQFVYQQIRKLDCDDLRRIKKEWKGLTDEQKTKYTLDEAQQETVR